MGNDLKKILVRNFLGNYIQTLVNQSFGFCLPTFCQSSLPANQAVYRFRKKKQKKDCYVLIYSCLYLLCQLLPHFCMNFRQGSSKLSSSIPAKPDSCHSRKQFSKGSYGKLYRNVVLSKLFSASLSHSNILFNRYLRKNYFMFFLCYTEPIVLKQTFAQHFLHAKANEESLLS